MTTAQVLESDGVQLVKLPEEFRFDVDVVSIRREGEAVILRPVKAATWPPGFFDAIAVVDPAFERPEQPPVPPAPNLD